MTRRYSVSEIGRMRNAVSFMVPKHLNGQDRLVAIEEWLRTYIANGTEPEELEFETVAERHMQQQQLRDMAQKLRDDV